MNAWSFQKVIFNFHRNVRNVRNVPVFFTDAGTIFDFFRVVTVIIFAGMVFAFARTKSQLLNIRSSDVIAFFLLILLCVRFLPTKSTLRCLPILNARLMRFSMVQCCYVRNGCLLFKTMKWVLICDLQKCIRFSPTFILSLPSHLRT